MNMFLLLRKIGRGIYELTETTTFAFAIFIVAYVFLFQPMEVQGASSYPTLKQGEKMFVEKVTPKLFGYNRGDFVVPESPTNPNVDLVKRVIGLPGEEIMIKNCGVYVNGSLLAEPYINSSICTKGGPYLPEGKEVTIPKGSYFLMGDNRNNSLDSRVFGYVDKNKIVGRALFRFWPIARFGAI
jgi:signal peptidase I